MQADAVRAQASTLEHWASEWDRATSVEHIEGAEEIVYQMGRLARLMIATTQPGVPFVEAKPARLPTSPEQDEPRAEE